MPTDDFQDQGGNPLPVPDPTKVTTEQIDKAVTNLKALMSSELEGLEKRVDERLRGIDGRFVAAESQRVEQKIDSATALTAALSAAEKAVREQTVAFAEATAKSEKATAEQLAQLTTSFTTATNNLTLTLNELKERVARVENITLGGQQHQAHSRQQTSAVVGYIVGAVGATTGIVIAITSLIP